MSEKLEAPGPETFNLVAYVFSPKAVPILLVLAALGGIVYGVEYLSDHADERIAKVAAATTEARISAVDSRVSQNQVTQSQTAATVADHETRLRILEITVSHVDANTTELLRRDDSRHPH